MTRRADPERKPQLLTAIIEYLADRPLSTLTFRGLAEHLDVSTFTLVYHFGTKDELMAEVVAGIYARQRRALDTAGLYTASIDDYFAGVRRFWQWGLAPHNRQLQRLAFEAAMIESLSTGGAGVTTSALTNWHDAVMTGLLKLGVPSESARSESRSMVTVMYGLQYDLIVLGDVDRVDDAFEHMLETFRQRIRSLTAIRA